MNDYENGEIWGWNGGKCPVHPDSEVICWVRSSVFTIDTEAGLVNWEHLDDELDIVCFQVTKPYAEPETIWVNDYKADDAWHGFLNEEQAKRYALRGVTRIGVKYVEEMK